ncbi:MAG: 3'-5' exonuclease [Muribaculaceae bacterium]|nr:3'-5' exonuclease [Muribaculaceae bacterium]
MELNLKRPLVVFDLESTGLNITEDRIIELSYVKVYPNGQEETKTYRINPEREIPQQAINVHGITNDDVKDKPTFKELAHDIARVFEGCDIAGFNSNHFDIPLLAQEMSKAGVGFDPSQHKFIDVQTIYHKREKRDLEAACLFYCGHPMENHHSAADDAKTTLEVLKAQLDHYANDEEPLKNDVDYLSQYSTHNRNVDLAGRIIYNENMQPVFNFGKHKGKTVEDVFTKLDFGYYDWMMKSDFAENTKQVITKLYIQYKKK